MPADHVVHCDDGILRHLEAYGPVGGLLQPSLSLFGAERQGVAERQAGLLVVGESLAASLGSGPRSLEILGRIEGVVGIAVDDELFGILAVNAAPLALPVRRVRMALRRRLYDAAVGVHSFVGHDAAPFQRLDDVFLRTWHETVGVGILDTEDEIAFSLLGKQVVVERRTDPAHVQGAGRGRRESHSRSSFHTISRYGCSCGWQECSPAC